MRKSVRASRPATQAGRAAFVRRVIGRLAVLTLVVAHGTRRYDDADLAFLVAVADWLGLGLENAGRREVATTRSSSRASVPPRFAEEVSTAVRRNPLARERASR